MQISEPFLPFSLNLSCKRIRFSDKLDLVDRIIPIDNKTCLLIDRARNFHLKVYSPEDEDGASIQFPLPPYAHNSNPNLLYSVDYLDLYHYIIEGRISSNDIQDYIYNLDRERTKYIQFVYLGDYKLAVQLGKNIPVMILDLHEPNNPPVFPEDIYRVKNLISVGNGCMVWYEKSKDQVILYHCITQKRKILNFTDLTIKELYSLKDHVVIAVSRRQIEILDYSKNKIIHSVGFINDGIVPDVVVHSEANLISYLEGFYLHICKTEKGKIKWQNYYEFKEYDEFATYKFITHNLIALKARNEIHILYIDSKSVSLHTVIRHPLLGFRSEFGLEKLCCPNASRDGVLWGIHPLGNNRFGVVECVCSEQFYSHGQQRVSVLKLENLRVESVPGQLSNASSIKFEISRSIIFEEFRDLVKAVDVFDDSFGMFITEKARLFRVDLKDYSVKFIVEVRGLVKQGEGDVGKIEKLFVLAENRVVITTKTDTSPYTRVVIFALNNRTVDFDSNELTQETEEEAQYSYYDVIKLGPNKILLSYKKVRNYVPSYNVGYIHDIYPQPYDGFFFREYNLQKKHQTRYDRLWNLDGSLVALRFGDNTYHLSFVDTKKAELKFLSKQFRAERYLSILVFSNIYGILDVRSVKKDVICIQIKLNSEKTIFVIYNIQTEQLLNKIETRTSMIGSMKHCFREQDRLRTIEKMMIFGDYKKMASGVIFKPMKDLLGKNLDRMEETAWDYGFCITSRNFVPLKTQNRALAYESDHHKNFICVLKAPNFKLECLRVFQGAVGNSYHKYIYKSVFETIFGVNQD